MIKKIRLSELAVADSGIGIEPAEFTTIAARNFIAAADKWLTGDAPFTAKLNPAYAPYAEFDQLMRLDEWYGREEGAQ